MERQEFITRPMSNLLDVVRALAALSVLAGHAIGFHLYDGPHVFDATAPHIAVMVFFVLSGLVITHSVQSKQVSASQYAAARIARIVPMTVVAVIFSLAVSLYGTSLGIEYTEDGPTIANVLLPLLYLSESAFGSGLVWNTPFWSLAYEAMYYALFGIAVFAKGWGRWALLAAVLALAGMKVLLLLPVWLIGVALARDGHRWRVSLLPGLALIAAGGWLVLFATAHSGDGTMLLGTLLGQTQEQLGFSEKALTDVFVGCGVALCFVGLRPVAALVEGPLERQRKAIRYAADMSFPLYIFHLPMLVLLAAYGVKAGTNPLAFVAILGGIIAVSVALAAPVDRRGAAVRAAVEEWLAKRGGPAEAVPA